MTWCITTRSLGRASTNGSGVVRYHMLAIQKGRRTRRTVSAISCGAAKRNTSHWARPHNAVVLLGLAACPELVLVVLATGLDRSDYNPKLWAVACRRYRRMLLKGYRLLIRFTM